MAKASREQAEQTAEKIRLCVIQTFLDEGISGISYNKIAEKTGLSKGAIQRVIPNKQGFADCFQGEVREFIATKIDFSSRESIKASWQLALEDHQFRNIMRYIFSTLEGGELAYEKTRYAFNQLETVIGKDLLHELIGISYRQLLLKPST